MKEYERNLYTLLWSSFFLSFLSFALIKYRYVFDRFIKTIRDNVIYKKEKRNVDQKIKKQVLATKRMRYLKSAPLFYRIYSLHINTIGGHLFLLYKLLSV